MISLRTIAVSLSLLVHGSLAYAVIWRPPAQPTDVLESGSGTDAMNVEAGIAIEGLAKLGDALETIETVEIAPVNASPPPPEDIKPVDELHDAITATDSPSEAPIAEVKEPPPVVEQVPPPEVQVQERAPDQVAILSQQSSGEAKLGSDAKAYGRYMGQINQRVQRAKINPRARIGGTVLMRFTVGLRGELLKTEVATSSGSPLLDKAAISALERAAPFPPIPPEVSTKPLAFTQPFRFIMR